MNSSGMTGIFFLIYILMMGGMVVGYIVLLVAVWRAMKAHESIAYSIRHIADKTGDTRKTYE